MFTQTVVIRLVYQALINNLIVITLGKKRSSPAGNKRVSPWKKMKPSRATWFLCIQNISAPARRRRWGSQVGDVIPEAEFQDKELPPFLKLPVPTPTSPHIKSESVFTGNILSPSLAHSDFRAFFYTHRWLFYQPVPSQSVVFFLSLGFGFVAIVQVMSKLLTYTKPRKACRKRQFPFSQPTSRTRARSFALIVLAEVRK